MPKRLVGRVSDDGYLLSCVYDEDWVDRSVTYFADYYEDHDIEINTLFFNDVPDDLAKKVVLIGTSDQEHSDGYEAYNQICEYLEDDEQETT